MLSPNHLAPNWSLPRQTSWTDALVAGHQITPELLKKAQASARLSGQPLEETLAVTHDISPLNISQALATYHDAQFIDPRIAPPSAELVAAWGPHNCLSDRVLPWRRVGACTVILATCPQFFARKRPQLEDKFGQIRMAVTTEDQLVEVVCTQFGPELTHRAETRVPTDLSCRNWNARTTLQYGTFAVIALAVALFTFPTPVMAVLASVALFTLAAQTAIKLVAIFLALRPEAVEENAAIPVRLPTITLLVPLYKEKEIASHLLHRLRALTYPRANLDVCVVIEADDTTTRAAIGVTNLPTWMRAITVPNGTLKTKPRALNYALDFAHGSIVGIYDAEDAPDVDQLEKVAMRFANRGPNVACLQGVLDYYNPTVNWLTRCFTLEYASWFRVVLPGFARMGMVVPLGGTTLFFRRDILEKLGCWDAHNVTEDADLGVRLARHGYSTELLPSTTQEEANGRTWPWIKQRSRWLKGYAITYGVHMRQPRQLWTDLGAWRFIAFQVQFLGTLLSFVLAPLLMSFWLVPLGYYHPLGGLIEGYAFWALLAVFVSAELVNLLAATVGVRKAGKPWLIKWALTLHLYFPLAAIAAYKGLIELAWKPFYWDKTTHGVMMGETTDDS
jgi:cellulose synthase/poly-beta-1,6-N-acetylglucosamine synthase-like glycosyltransferase